MPTTVDDLVERALTRINELTNSYPSTRGPMYERQGIRQRELFVRAAQINPDFYGRSVTQPLVSGAVDLSALPDVPELVQRIEIASPGASGYLAGDDVAVVSLTDPSGELAPRMTVREGRAVQVGTDLTGVTSITIWYAFLPTPIPITAPPSTLLSLAQPWDDLLELDLSCWLLDQATALDAAVRKLTIDRWRAEEASKLSRFDAHLRTVTPTVGRFLPPLPRPVPLG